MANVTNFSYPIKSHQHRFVLVFCLQEMCEFRKLLSNLNKSIALPVCLFTILNLSYTFSAIVYFIRIYNQYTSNKIVIMALVNILLWLILGLYPFLQVSGIGMITHWIDRIMLIMLPYHFLFDDRPIGGIAHLCL